MQAVALPVVNTIPSSNKATADEFKVPGNRAVKSKSCNHRLLNRIGASDDFIKSGVGKISIGLVMEIIGPIVGDFIGWQLNKAPLILHNVTKMADTMLIFGAGTVVYLLSSGKSNQTRTIFTTAALASMMGITAIGEFFAIPVSAFLRDRISPSVGVIVGGILFKEMFGYSVGSLDGKEGYLQSTGRFILAQLAFDAIIPVHSDLLISTTMLIPRTVVRSLTGITAYHWYKTSAAFQRYLAQERSDRHFLEIFIEIAAECIKDRANKEGIARCLSESLPKFLTFFETQNNLFIEQIRSTLNSTIKTAADQTKVTFILLEKYLSDVKNDSEILSIQDAFKTQFMSCINKVDQKKRIELERIKNALTESIKKKLGIANKQTTTKPTNLLESVSNYFVHSITEKPDNRISQFCETTITSITAEFVKCLDEIHTQLPKFITKKIAEELFSEDQKVYIKELFEIHLKHFLLFTLEKQQAFQNEPLSHVTSNKLVTHLHQLLFSLPNSPNRFSHILNVIEKTTFTALDKILTIYSGKNASLRHSGEQKDRHTEPPTLQEDYHNIDPISSASSIDSLTGDASPLSSPSSSSSSPSLSAGWESVLPPVQNIDTFDKEPTPLNVFDDKETTEEDDWTNLTVQSKLKNNKNDS